MILSIFDYKKDQNLINRFLGKHSPNFHIRNHDQYFEIGMGYEVQYFWRVNQTFGISDVQPPLTAVGPVRVDYKRSSEDLSFYGITFKARLDF